MAKAKTQTALCGVASCKCYIASDRPGHEHMVACPLWRRPRSRRGPTKYRLINGDDVQLLNDAELQEVLLDLVTHNDTVTFCLSDAGRFMQTIKVG